jgi:hypothetical protein
LNIARSVPNVKDPINSSKHAGVNKEAQFVAKIRTTLSGKRTII